MKTPIYLDYAATTPVDPRVAEKMAACMTMDGNFGNPASRSHVFGWEAEESVENSRPRRITLPSKVLRILISVKVSTLLPLKLNTKLF